MKHCTYNSESVTRFGYFSLVFVSKFLTQVAVILGDFLGSFKIMTFKVKTAEYASWATNGQIWATFYSNIWTH